jgi:putative ABC transport system permease protein
VLAGLERLFCCVADITDCITLCCCDAGADRIERLLALGATRWEATSELLVRATKTAMTPLLNQMSVVGLVSIPGMMTGQILAGSDPSQAAR